MRRPARVYRGRRGRSRRLDGPGGNGGAGRSGWPRRGPGDADRGWRSGRGATPPPAGQGGMEADPGPAVRPARRCSRPAARRTNSPTGAGGQAGRSRRPGPAVRAGTKPPTGAGGQAGGAMPPPKMADDAAAEGDGGMMPPPKEDGGAPVPERGSRPSTRSPRDSGIPSNRVGWRCHRRRQHTDLATEKQRHPPLRRC